jgi:hypothetical protein
LATVVPEYKPEYALVGAVAEIILIQIQYFGKGDLSLNSVDVDFCIEDLCNELILSVVEVFF